MHSVYKNMHSSKTGRGMSGASEPAVPQVEPQELFDSLIRTYEKLKELGFTYYNGKVCVIESGEEDSHV